MRLWFFAVVLLWVAHEVIELVWLRVPRCVSPPVAALGPYRTAAWREPASRLGTVTWDDADDELGPLR